AAHNGLFVYHGIDRDRPTNVPILRVDSLYKTPIRAQLKFWNSSQKFYIRFFSLRNIFNWPAAAVAQRFIAVRVAQEVGVDANTARYRAINPFAIRFAFRDELRKSVPETVYAGFLEMIDAQERCLGLALVKLRIVGARHFSTNILFQGVACSRLPVPWVCLFQVCLFQVCLFQVCLFQVCLFQVCLFQVCLFQVWPVPGVPVQVVCLFQVCLFQVCLFQVCLFQVCLFQVCLFQVCLFQVCLQCGLFQVCLFQVCLFQVQCLFQVCLFQVCLFLFQVLFQVCLFQVCLFQVCIQTRYKLDKKYRKLVGNAKAASSGPDSDSVIFGLGDRGNSDGRFDVVFNPSWRQRRRNHRCHRSAGKCAAIGEFEQQQHLEQAKSAACAENVDNMAEQRRNQGKAAALWRDCPGGQFGWQLFTRNFEATWFAGGMFFDDEVTEDVVIYHFLCYHYPFYAVSIFAYREIDQLNPRTCTRQLLLSPIGKSSPRRTILNGDILTLGSAVSGFRHATPGSTCASGMTVRALEVTLSDESADPHTVFKMHPVLQETPELKFESYARIEHVITGSWLHAI
uniref:Transmembrane protein n=1 Tax=Macrostomum lignano TaxID=282301 RepID=A0A1I8FDR6_9PLAT